MRQHDSQTILAHVADYYSDKVIAHGETPQGVDWNSEAGQVLRFQQLTKVIDLSSFSINDLGCGYGALVPYLDQSFGDYTYLGVDVSAEMVEAGQRRYAQHSRVRFVCASEPDTQADFGLASGIFNVRLNYSPDEWLAYILSVLDVLDRTSCRGFSFNCLTSYSDEHRKRNDLFYADPAFLFDLCKRRYAPNIALLHDYGLYEFTILVRKAL